MTQHRNRRSRAGNTQPGKRGPQVGVFYWERHPHGPFATLIAVAATYCGPDAYDECLRRPHQPGPGTRTR